MCLFKRLIVSVCHLCPPCLDIFVCAHQSEGLGSVPASDLGGIIARIAATRMAKDGLPQQPQQQQLAAPEPSAAAKQQQEDGADDSGDECSSSSSLPAIVQESMPQAWKALACVAGKMVDMFKPIAFVENKDTDTQVDRGRSQITEPRVGVRRRVKVVGSEVA